MIFKIYRNLPKIIALGWAIFQIYFAFRPIPLIIQRPFHVAFALVLVFLTRPMIAKKNSKGFTLVDLLLATISIVATIYIAFNCERLSTRIPFVSEVSFLDILIGIVFIILLIEAGRRIIGWSLSIVCITFIIYAFTGSHFSGLLAHRGMNIVNFVELQFLSTEGVFGTPVGVSASTVYYFLLFGAFLAITPASNLFISLASAFTGRTRGGAGKTTIIASALFGMISGSAAANVVSTGNFTYPLMEKDGYPPKFSAAVLAVAGTGGQIMPPIMGAAAFLMVDMIGVPYNKIMLAAIIPAFLYVASLYFVIDLKSEQLQILSSGQSIADDLKQIKKYIHMTIPLFILVILIILGRSLMYSSLISTLVLVVICFLRKDTRLGILEIAEGLIKGSMSAVVVAIPCALAGIVVGIIVYTGLGLKFSSLVAAISSGNLFVVLVLTMLLSIILGMGMPTTAAYLMCAVLLAPVMQYLNTKPIVAHFFVFYFSNLSMITPPVALASYAAAGLAKTNLWETGLEAFKISFVIFIIPFTFVYNPALLGIGTTIEILWALITATAGVWCMAGAVTGYFYRKLSYWFRAILVFNSLLFIIPEYITSLAGIFILLIFYLLVRRAKNEKCSVHLRMNTKLPKIRN